MKIPCSKLQGIFDRKESALFYGPLAYPAASGGECARFRGSKTVTAEIKSNKNASRFQKKYSLQRIDLKQNIF
ncbi:MAG TPA: hypothetical protein VLR50_15810 [Desulfobacterales bacterium]|nr:hypothetical protein [Desulfobacterales bacterium]